MRIRRGSESPVFDLHRRMEEVMDRLMRDIRPLGGPASWMPRADVCETAEGYVVTLELSGVDRDRIDIVVEGAYLTVSGERAEPDQPGCVRWHQMEITHGRFERILALPQEADASGIEATYADGFLSIRIPRSAKATRTVPIDET